MNKVTKGAIAAAAGVILLMGGAGTLASWNSSANAGSNRLVSPMTRPGSRPPGSAGSGTQVSVKQDPVVKAWTPSAKLGLIVYLW